MRKLLFSILCMGISAIAFAQHAEDTTAILSKEVDSTYIKSYANKLGIYFYNISKSSRFEFLDHELKKSINYRPNENVNLGLGFNYKWLGAAMAANFSFINNDNDYRGMTRSLDLQAEMFPKNWLVSASIQLYKGYYWSNPQSFYPDWNADDSLFIRDDIFTYSLGTTAVYVLNNSKFSYKAPFANTEQQLKSAGSFLLGGTVSLYGVYADKPILPEAITELYPEAAKIARLNSFLWGALAGYSYNLVIHKNLYANLTLMAGLNYQRVRTYDVNEQALVANGKVAGNGAARFALGYNTDKWYVGMMTYNNTYILRNTNRVDVNYQVSRFRFFYGRRFTAPKWKILEKL